MPGGGGIGLPEADSGGPGGGGIGLPDGDSGGPGGLGGAPGAAAAGATEGESGDDLSGVAAGLSGAAAGRGCVLGIRSPAGAEGAIDAEDETDAGRFTAGGSAGR